MLVTAAKAQQAADILGVELSTLGPEGLSNAYRTASKACHPDSNNDPEQWARVSWAKDCLTRWLAKQPAKVDPDVTTGNCRACGGTGRVAVSVASSFGKATSVMCVMCNGNGNL